jgi:hypothetical protein
MSFGLKGWNVSFEDMRIRNYCWLVVIPWKHEYKTHWHTRQLYVPLMCVKRVFHCHGELKQNLMPIFNQFFSICKLQLELEVELIELYWRHGWQVCKNVSRCRDMSAPILSYVSHHINTLCHSCYLLRFFNTDILVWDKNIDNAFEYIIANR